MSRDVIEMRKIKLNNKTYIRVEDIVYYLECFAATEDIDTQKRILMACDNISGLMD